VSYYAEHRETLTQHMDFGNTIQLAHQCGTPN